MRTLLLILTLALVAPFVHADLVTVGSGLNTSLLYYQPVPAHPGDEINVWIQITNKGGSASKTGTLTILDTGPFTVNADDMVSEFPSIPGQESFLLQTKVRVSKDANEGTSNLKVRVQEKGSTSYRETNLPITITGTSSSLSIIEAYTTPEEVLPGERTTLTVRVRNVGETLVRNVDVALDLDDLSLAPAGSSDSKTISSLGGGQEYTFTFDLISFPDAEAKAYQVPITLTYDDEEGDETSQEETVGIVIGAQPELLVYFERVGMTKSNPQGEVVIQFVNKGLAEIKLLEMEVLESETVKVISETPIIYVGNIDEDDYESASIVLAVSPDTTSVPVRIAYKDALNRQYEEQYDLTLRLSEGNGNGGPNWLLWIVIIAVIAGGWWYWKRRK